VAFIGISNFSLRAQVAWKASVQEDLMHCMQAPMRTSHNEHLFEPVSQ
jgi:hypothetical protein